MICAHFIAARAQAWTSFSVIPASSFFKASNPKFLSTCSEKEHFLPPKLKTWCLYVLERLRHLVILQPILRRFVILMMVAHGKLNYPPPPPKTTYISSACMHTSTFSYLGHCFSSKPHISLFFCDELCATYLFVVMISAPCITPF